MHPTRKNRSDLSYLIQAEHSAAREEAISTQKYVLLNGLLQCPSGVSLPMPWYVEKMKAETIRIVELLGGRVLPDFEPETGKQSNA